MSSYDCIVVGAGPAGASAAYFLARGGLKVLILEKKKLPRYKCCAGGIPLKVSGVLDFDLSPCQETEVRGTVFSWLSRHRRYIGGSRLLGWVVRREFFDHYLVEKAEQAGAQVRAGEEVIGILPDDGRVIVHTRRDSFISMTAIGADGAFSRVARQLSLKCFKNFGFGLEARLRVPEQVLKDRGSYLYFDFGGVPGGYTWIFPRRDHLCAGIATTRAPRSRLRIYLQEYLEREGLQREFAGARVMGAPLSFSLTARGLVRGNCLLAGDAAGLTDRLTGEGIYYALKSGELAARAVIDYLLGRAELKHYQLLVREQLGSNLFWANLFSRIRGAFPQSVFNRVLSDRRRARKGMLVTVGKLDYRQLVFGKKE